MTDLSTYLSKAADILHDYQWVYNFRATHLLVNNILTHIPKVWIQALLDLSDDDISLLANGIVKDGWPTCLSDFVHRCHELMLPHADMGSFSHCKGWDYIPADLQKGMSPKKQHEVLHLTSFIYHQCCESNLSRILDLGSGLGYLGKLLHHRSGYRVLGLEANAGCVGKAVSMQQPVCSSGVKHVALTLRPAHREEDWKMTVHQVKGVLEDRGNWQGRCSCGTAATEVGVTVDESEGVSGEAEEDPVCMVSLHSCGDLSPTALRLFLELPQAMRLVVMSCCFHKMKTAHGGCRTKERPSEGGNESALLDSAGDAAIGDADEEIFPDFPMSVELDGYVRGRRSFLRRPLLRLASEMTVEMWRLMTAKQRHEHSVHVLGRAVFELYAKRERYKLKKMRRRGVRKTKRSNFDDYLEDALQRFQFTHSCHRAATHLSPGCCGDDGRDHSPAPAGHRDHYGDGYADGASNSPSRLANSFFGIHGGLCSPSPDIPFIDEDEFDDGSRTAWPSGSDSGPGNVSTATEVPLVDPMNPTTCAACREQIPLEVHRAKLKALTEEQCTPETLRLTTALYALQATIQAIAEGLVIADRLAFLLERGGSSIEASLVRVFDRSLSPRSLAIVARKDSPLVHVNNK